MKRVRTLALAGMASAALATASACVDLFHSTDFETLCDAHPETCGSSDAGPAEAAVEAGDAGSTNFCSWSTESARTHAEHACAWLGACTVPFDDNAFGPCMIHAILAYDCATNPDMTITEGPLHAMWDAMWRAKSCADVTDAVNPQNVGCSQTGYACGGSTAPDLYFECLDGVGGPESCLIEGRVCGGSSGCAPPHALGTCDKSKCDGTVLHDCEHGDDLGIDCQYFGAGMCASEPAAGIIPVCAPAGGGGMSCTPTNDVVCVGDEGDTATACPTGASVSVACAALTGATTCKPGTPSPQWNVAAACQGHASCAPSCDGDTLTGCAQGAKFTTSCSAEGLGSCRSVDLADMPKGFACSAPGAK